VKRLAVVGLVVVVVAIGGLLFYPRAERLSVANAATLTVLHGEVAAQKSGAADFAPALDGDLLTNGDTVRADAAGNAVITFFDGSTLTVESGAQARIVSLARTGGAAIQVAIEQTLGRTWASVQNLGAGSSFQIRTPAATATVRGTAFETIVATVNGISSTTVKTTEGQVAVQGSAGGQTTVGPGQEVQVAQGAAAPTDPTISSPRPRLDFMPLANVRYTVIDPRGLQCGATIRQIPGCDPSGGAVSIGGPVTGTYAVVLNATSPAPGAVLAAEGSRGPAKDFSARFSANLSVGGLVRTTLGVTAPAAGPLATSGFTAAELIASVCDAEAGGRVFSSGAVASRGDALASYGRQAPQHPAAIVLRASELTDVAGDSLKDADLPVDVSGIAVTIDNAGLHVPAQVHIGPLSVPATATVIAGTRGGWLVLKTRDLDLGPVPSGAKDELMLALDRSLADFAGSFPLVVERVAFRSGCLAVLGTTP